MLARTSSRSFGHRRIRRSWFARSSCLFRFDPKSRSDLVDQDVLDTPDMISKSCGHGRGARIPAMFTCAQFMVRDTPIIGTSNQIHSGLERFETLSRMPTFARQRSQPLTHRPIEPLNKGGIENGTTH